MSHKEKESEKARPTDWQEVSQISEYNGFYSYVNDSLISNHTYSRFFYHDLTLQDEEVMLTFTHHNRSYVLALTEMQIHLFSTGVGLFIYSIANTDPETNTPNDIEYLSRQCSYLKTLIHIKCPDSLSNKFPVLKSFQIEKELLEKEMRTIESEKLVSEYIGSFHHNISINSLLNKASHTFIECIDDNIYSLTQGVSKIEETPFKCFLGSQASETISFDLMNDTGCIQYVNFNNCFILSKEVNALCTPYIDHLRRLVELALLQRHTLITIENDIKLITSSEIKKLNNIFKLAEKTYQKYIRFSNQFNFEQVSERQQLNDFYQDIQNKMNIQRLGDSVGKKINELYQYISIMEGRGQNIKANKLNVLASISIPTSIVIGICGMNSLGQNDQLMYQLGFVLLGLIIGGLITMFLNRE